jgi:hypothetical protein
MFLCRRFLKLNKLLRNYVLYLTILKFGTGNDKLKKLFQKIVFMFEELKFLVVGGKPFLQESRETAVVQHTLTCPIYQDLFKTAIEESPTFKRPHKVFTRPIHNTLL